MEIKYYNDIEQKTIEWHELRLGKMSASKIHSIVDVKKKMQLKSNSVVLGAVASVIAEICTGFSNDTDYVSESMEWGNENEDGAIAMVKTDECFQTGGVTNSYYELFWLSPDLLSTKKGYEIKCFSSKVYAETVIQNKIPAKHLPQVLAYMVIMPKLESVDFVLYDPRYAKKNHHVINAKRSDYVEHIENMSNSIKQFSKLVKKNLELFI